MPQRDQGYHPVWRVIGYPVVQWLTLTGMLVVLSLVIAGGIDPQRFIENGGRSAKPPSPFDLEALRERLPPDAIKRVQGFVQYYRENRRRGFRDSLARSTRYVDQFKQIFREAKLPEELAYLPLIESGFIEHAVSSANAVGVWQFIEETGRRYDLKTSRWYDQKLDPIQSARAASKFLGHLHKTFGNWELALAAYNSGEGTVRWALRNAGKAGLPQTFWNLHDLPDETRAYVPAFLAAMLIAKNPSAYGFDEIDFHPQVTYEQIKVNSSIALSELAAQLELDEKSLRDLNPSLVAGMTPPGTSPYILRVPHGMRSHLELRSAGHAGATNRDWLVHQVEARDTLQRLATKFRTDPELIKAFNGITSDSDLTAGRLIVIPL